jgi:zinc and cadmium transporter
MQSSVFILILLSLLGSVAGLVGGAIFLIKREWSKVLSFYAIPFAAGVLLSVSVLHLIPEASEQIGERAFMFTLIAFLAAFIFEKYFASLHHHEGHEGTLQKTTIPLVIFGDTIHNFIDGVAIAAAYLTSPGLGLTLALSTFLHETPHEIGDFGVLVSRGWSRKKTFIANFFSALATIPGALVVFYLFPNAGEGSVAWLLAVAAGIFLYLGASDFLPEVGEHDNKRDTFIKVALVVIGVFSIYFLSQILPE